MSFKDLPFKIVETPHGFQAWGDDGDVSPLKDTREEAWAWGMVHYMHLMIANDFIN